MAEFIIICLAESWSTAGYTLIAKYAKTIVKYEKQKVYSKVFWVTFFVFLAPFFAFRILQCFALGLAFA